MKTSKNIYKSLHLEFNMNLKRGEWLLVIFNLAYVLAYGFYYLSIKNYEFLWYVLVLVFFALLVVATLRKTNFDYIVLWGLSLWGFLHMSGGGLIVPGTGRVLYALEVFRFFNIGDTYVLKFDQVVHAFGFGVTTLVAYQLLKPRIKNMHKGLLYGLCVFIAMGAGALNEIVEFLAVVLATETGVGGYFNTGLDIVFNGIGSLIAVVFIYFYYK